MRGISWRAEDLVASQKDLCSMDLVHHVIRGVHKTEEHAEKGIHFQTHAQSIMTQSIHLFSLLEEEVD